MDDATSKVPGGRDHCKFIAEIGINHIQGRFTYKKRAVLKLLPARSARSPVKLFLLSIEFLNFEARCARCSTISLMWLRFAQQFYILGKH